MCSPRNTLALACFFLLFAAPSKNTAQRAAPPPLTNKDVISLVSSGLSDDVIITLIHKSSSTNFDTSVSGLQSLKAAGVSSALIGVMLDPSSSARSASPSPLMPNSYGAYDSDDPMAMHIGFYVQQQGNDGKLHLVQLANEIQVGRIIVGGGSMFGISLGSGGKEHYTVRLSHPTSPLHIANANPTFYVYLSPQERIDDIGFVRFIVEKNDDRYGYLGLKTTFGHPPTGVDPAIQTDYTTEQIKPGVFKVVMKAPLPPGEYGFQQVMIHSPVGPLGVISKWLTFDVQPAQ